MPISETLADQEIAAFYREYPGLATLNIVHEDTQEKFYGPRASIENIGYAIKGAFLPATREVHLALANFHNAEDFRRSLRHEALGHFGLLTFRESQKRDLLGAIIESKNSPSLKMLWRYADNHYAPLSDLMKAEEIFCLVAEDVCGRPSQSKEEASRIFSEVVLQKKRPLEFSDLQTFTHAVADGIHRGTRSQQIFPQDNRSQFSLSPTSHKNSNSALSLVQELLGPKATFSQAKAVDGEYRGKIIAETASILFQQVSQGVVIGHEKSCLTSKPEIKLGISVSVTYREGSASIMEARAPELTQKDSSSLGR